MKINYCVQCAEPLTNHDDTCYECTNGHMFYNNPNPGSAVVLLDQNRLLVVGRAIDPHKGKYCLPGGFLQYGEDGYTAAKREAKEELGIDVSKLYLLDTYASDYEENSMSCTLIFVATEWQGNLKAADDASDFAWRPLEFIESDDFAWHYPGLLAKLQTIADNS